MAFLVAALSQETFKDLFICIKKRKAPSFIEATCQDIQKKIVIECFGVN
jgi:hypothetical protein